MEIIHNLELTRLKAENQGRIEVAKQKVLIEGGGAKGETAEGAARTRAEVEEMREIYEIKMEEAKDKREEELKGIFRAIKADYKMKLERESTRIQREHQMKAQTECEGLKIRQEEDIDRMLASKREMREKILISKLQMEK